MAFDLNNTLWNYNHENFQNVNVHKSLPNAPTNQAFNIPMGNSGKTYQAPVGNCWNIFRCNFNCKDGEINANRL